MKLYRKKCKNPLCGKDFMGTRTQQYCCTECRPTVKEHKPPKDCSLGEMVRKANAEGISYGKYVAMQYQKERMKINE